MHIVSRVSPRLLVRLLRLHLQLVSSALPAVGIAPSPAVGPLFSLAISITLRGVLNLVHASPLRIISSHASESADFTQVLVVVSAAAGCLTFWSVCLSVCRSPLRDVLMVSHELLGCELFARVLTHVLRVVCWTDQPYVAILLATCVRMRACFAYSALASGARSRRSSLSRARHSCSPAATAALAVCLVVSGHLNVW